MTPFHRHVETAPLQRFRCGACTTYLEIARVVQGSDPACPECDLAMRYQGCGPVVFTLGTVFRSGNCAGCRGRIMLVVAADWSPFCAACQISRGRHHTLGAPLEEWSALSADASAIAARLLFDLGGPSDVRPDPPTP